MVSECRLQVEMCVRIFVAPELVSGSRILVGTAFVGERTLEKRGIVAGHKDAPKREAARTMRREMTEAESLLWRQVKSNRCGGLHFRRQQVIDGFIADFYCHAAGLIVEVDGGIHQEQADYDALRDQILTTRGLRVVRFANERIYTDMAGVLKEIQATAATNEIKSDDES
jgi:very-short-patch-repair endonuclease